MFKRDPLLPSHIGKDEGIVIIEEEIDLEQHMKNNLEKSEAIVKLVGY